MIDSDVAELSKSSADAWNEWEHLTSFLDRAREALREPNIEQVWEELGEDIESSEAIDHLKDQMRALCEKHQNQVVIGFNRYMAEGNWGQMSVEATWCALLMFDAI